MKIFSTFFSIFILWYSAVAQQGNYTAFTVNDGLPSNHIYQCLEDKHGFLWIATDAGIARFDGKYFQVFTTEHGLPDNEVLQIAKEKDGTIWANCFKQSPSYFDEVKNRFISATIDTSLKIFGTSNMNLFPLPDGGVLYHNEYGCVIFKNRKQVSQRLKRNVYHFLIRDNSNGSAIFWRFSKVGNKSAIIESTAAGDIDSVPVGVRNNGPYVTAINDGRFFVFERSSSTLFIYSNFKTSPLRFHTDTIITPEPFFHLSFSENKFFYISNSGKLYVYNNQTGKIERIISGNYLPNAYYNDSKGNAWISTIDKGLLVYRKKHIAAIDMPSLYSRNNFISLAKKGQSIFAGNYYGEVVEVKNQQITVHQIINKTPSRQRKIIVAGTNIYTISEDGLTLNFNPKPAFSTGKTGLLYNDSIMLMGTTSGIVIINTVRNQIIEKLRYKRVTALTQTKNGMVYMGSTDGVHTFEFHTRNFKPISTASPLLADRIAAICTTPDDIVWIATSANGLVAMRQGLILASIGLKDGIINTACRTVSAGAPGQVWLGTAQGISKITYKLTGRKIAFSIQNLTINDGLVSNEINDLLYADDTMYVATGNGLSLVPPDLSLPKFNIPVKVVRMNINQRDTVLKNIYHLNPEQHDILMQFAAIELNGHFSRLQYSTGESKEWIELPGLTLTLKLNSGMHIIRVRAVDVNGNIGEDILVVRFEIDTLIWETVWFWLVVAAVSQLIMAYAISRWLKRRKEAKIAREMAVVQTASLEQQAFTSLMNPHFMFNALNSIQHYINVQDRHKANHYLSDFASLIRKNFEAAHQSFISLDQEIENIKIYLRLEQMRFVEKFEYNVSVDRELDTEAWMIPTMIMQPLLENAVLHGIMPSQIRGLIEVVLIEENNHLHISIKDNGIGIDNSNASKLSTDRKSRGMELIQKRIKALSKVSKNMITLEMSTPYDSVTNPGNLTTIILPHNLHGAWLKVQKDRLPI